MVVGGEFGLSKVNGWLRGQKKCRAVRKGRMEGGQCAESSGGAQCRPDLPPLAAPGPVYSP